MTDTLDAATSFGRRCDTIVKLYAGELSPHRPATFVTTPIGNALVDLMHFCALKDITFQDALDQAQEAQAWEFAYLKPLVEMKKAQREVAQ